MRVWVGLVRPHSVKKNYEYPKSELNLAELGRRTEQIEARGKRCDLMRPYLYIGEPPSRSRKGGTAAGAEGEPTARRKSLSTGNLRWLEEGSTTVSLKHLGLGEEHARPHGGRV